MTVVKQQRNDGVSWRAGSTKARDNQGAAPAEFAARTGATRGMEAR